MMRTLDAKRWTRSIAAQQTNQVDWVIRGQNDSQSMSQKTAGRVRCMRGIAGNTAWKLTQVAFVWNAACGEASLSLTLAAFSCIDMRLHSIAFQAKAHSRVADAFFLHDFEIRECAIICSKSCNWKQPWFESKFQGTTACFKTTIQ